VSAYLLAFAIRGIIAVDKIERVKDIIEACRGEGFTDEQCAYTVATVEHETNGTFEPVREAYWLPEWWRKRRLRYYPWYGRGLVQITWKENYAKFERLLGVPLTQDPDLALEWDTSVDILVKGFKDGHFTGKKISDYIRPGHTDWNNARRCINGTDRAAKIAALAIKWLQWIHKNVPLVAHRPA
jgi:hypothetical protein